MIDARMPDHVREERHKRQRLAEIDATELEVRHHAAGCHFIQNINGHADQRKAEDHGGIEFQFHDRIY